MFDIFDMLSAFMRAKVKILIGLIALALGTAVYHLVSGGASGVTTALAVAGGLALMALAWALVWFWSRVLSGTARARNRHRQHQKHPTGTDDV
jgi:membrane protein implicated in regulation of membrane protease activity